MTQFADWLSRTSLSLAIQTRNGWVIPTLQSIHIVAISVVVGSVFMIDLRILGWAGQDQTLRQTTNRFAPWLTGALCVLLATGALMVVGEPTRELVNFSFWFKMCLIVVGTFVAAVFQGSLRRNEQRWEESLGTDLTVKVMAIGTLMIWVAIVILGRLIAYDHVWGAWSPAPKA